MSSSLTGITKQEIVTLNILCLLTQKQVYHTPLAQMVVAVVLHTTGHRFDPCRVYNRLIGEWYNDNVSVVRSYIGVLTV